MIDLDKYTYHIEILGKEEFKNSIDAWKVAAPWMTDEEISKILDEEQKENIGPSLWCRPWN